MNPKTRLIAITAVFLAALGSHAYAGDNKVYPGAMCQPHDGTLSILTGLVASSEILALMQV